MGLGNQSGLHARRLSGDRKTGYRRFMRPLHPIPRPLSLLACLCAGLLLPAGQALADTVDLANGGRFTGAIIEEDATTLTILADGVQWTFKRDEVKSIRRDTATNSRARAQQDRLRKDQENQRLGIAADDAEEETSSEVVLYSTSWCGYCAAARTFLERRGVEYVEKDVEKSSSARSELQKKKRKARLKGEGVPVIDVRGRLVMGFDAAQLDRLLQEGNSPPPTESRPPRRAQPMRR